MKNSLIVALFTILVSANAHSARSDDVQLFTLLDTNRDGVLNKQEVYTNKKAIRFTNLYYQESFYKADINSDGLLDFNEYIANEEDIY